MEDKEIIEIINEFEKDFKSYKDSGRSMIRELALSLNRAGEGEKKEIIDFFLREISTNKNDLWALSLEVIIGANLVMLAPELERVYYLYFETKDEKWRERIIMAMLRLNYDKPYELYNSYIAHHLEENTGRAFFLMVQYCRVDFSRGIELLSSYYANNLLSKESYEYNNQYHIGYLIHWLIDTSKDCLSEIIKQTSTKNKIAGNYLKEDILSFLKTGKSGDLKWEQVQETIRKINEVPT